MVSDSTKLSIEERKRTKRHRIRQLDKLMSFIGVKFKNKSLLSRALTHRSYVNESGFQTRDNERLEYLGDSVLALVVNEYLYSSFEDYKEGNLAKIKSAVVSEATLAKAALRIDLGRYILMGKGEEQCGGRDRPSILANTLEAIIGSIYLDSGLKESRKFILNLLKRDIERIDSLTYLRDPKTTLQEYVQKKYKERPVYEVVEERGPDHSKEFIVRLVINGSEILRGEGTSKRKAEMDAAMETLRKIETGELLI
ncbi:MAG TPA: ribonuclease III [Spirochaetota bacterium]|nr:ribonuclease III [Spirochaetota bacterium]